MDEKPNRLTRPFFGRQVRDALLRLYDLPYLQSHPLARALGQTTGVKGPETGRALEQHLKECIERLRPSADAPPAGGRAGRRHHLFELRYIEGLEIGATCAELGVSQSEYYREHRLGLEAIVSALYSEFQQLGALPPDPFRVVSSEPPGGPSPARTPLVGRLDELRSLRAQYEAVAAWGRGQGQVVLIGGEPGVGKSRLAEEVGRYASERGGLFLKSQYLRDSTGPYAPWVDILRMGRQTLKEEDIVRAAGAYAADLARLLPDLPQSLAGGSTSISSDSEEQRYRLFEGIAGVLSGLGQRVPLVVQIDDLQWSRGLNVLTHVARRLSECRMLLVGTYRDLELEEQPLLLQRRNDLVRARLATSMKLHALNEEETAKFVAVTFGQPVADRLGRTIFRPTRGNPLFIEEVLRSLAERGSVRAGSQGWEVADGALMTMPQSLGQLVRERIARLGEGAEGILAQAAVLGTEFSIPVLEAMSGVSEEVLVDVLERGMMARLLVDRSVPGEERVAFADDQFREVLYAGLTPLRRRRLHLQAGRAMEAVCQDGLEEHAGELARHLIYATDRSDLSRALQYAETAAGRAERFYSYTEGAVQWERALKVQEALDPEDKKKRCDLLLALGNARVMAFHPPAEINAAANGALELAEELGDGGRAFRACMVALAPSAQDDGAASFGTPVWRQWSERADRHAAPDTPDRVHADLAVAAVYEAGGDLAKARAALRRALELARGLDAAEPFFSAAARLLWRVTPQRWEDALGLAEEVAVRPRAGVSLGTLCFALRGCLHVFLAHARLRQAEEVLREIRELATHTDTPRFVLDALYGEAVVAQLGGDLTVALEAGSRLVHRADELGRPAWGRRMAAHATFRPLLYLGRGEDALAALPRPSQSREAGASLAYSDSARRATALAHLGHLAEASAVLRGLLALRDLGSEEDETHIGALTELLETTVFVGECEMAGLLSRRLAGLSRAPSAGGWIFTSVGRHLGSAAALLGDHAAARSYYLDALEVCQKIRFRPEVALIRAELGELLLTEKDTEGIEHLDAAIAEFRVMGMQPALDRALRLRAPR